MSTPAKRRIMRDFKDLESKLDSGVNAAPNSEDIMKWEAVIFGPEGTPFEGGTFKLKMEFSNSYPMSPPKVKFMTKMFHPNIYANGSVCLDILQNRWSPSYSIHSVLISIQSLLHDPNPSSPANTEASKFFTTNTALYLKKVRETVEESWTDNK